MNGIIVACSRGIRAVLRSKLAMRSMLRFDVALFEQWGGSGNVKLFSNHDGEMSKRIQGSSRWQPMDGLVEPVTEERNKTIAIRKIPQRPCNKAKTMNGD